MRALLALLLLPACLTSREDYLAMLAFATDADGDGYAPAQGDCDDADPGVFPGGEDVWYDGVDGDCDGRDDLDADGDGSPIPDDCDDADPLVRPGLTEECDGVDEDCDGAVDEGLIGTWAADTDGDGWGDEATAITTCLPPEGWVSALGDCDDDEPAVYPGAEEVCEDGVVNACEGYDGSCRSTGALSLGTLDGHVVVTAMWGGADGDLAGLSLSMGDANFDGLADLLIGAPGEDTHGAGAGAVYLLLSPHPEGELELADAATMSFLGGTTNRQAGLAASFLEDIDGDGREEILIATRDSASGAQGAVLLTALGNPGEVDLDLNRRAVYLPERFNMGALRSVGDVTGAGGAHFAIGHPGWSVNTGAVYVWGYFLGPQAADDAPLILRGASAFGEAGVAIARAGDPNGDGVPDLLIGAPGHDNGRGAVYHVEGPVSGERSLADADAILEGDAAGDGLGLALAGGGDINGDGRDDLLLGAPDAQVAGKRPGRAYVFTSTPSGTLRVANAALIVTGSEDEDSLGAALELSTDLDADGRDDLIISAPQADAGAERQGAVYLWYDPLLGGADPDGADLRFTGAEAMDGAGASLSGGRDVNGDGVDDLLIGSLGARRGTLTPGAAHLILGRGP